MSRLVLNSVFSYIIFFRPTPLTVVDLVACANASISVAPESLPGSRRVSRVGFGVSPKQSLQKSAMTRRHRQHVRRVRYPELPLPRVSLPADAIFFVNTSSVPRRRKI